MMLVVSWNIQCGLGCDGRFDLPRIAETIKEGDPPDVICLQEVCRHMPTLDGGRSEDQVAVLAGFFEGYEPAFGAAIDRLGPDGHRQQLGNLIFSRLPLLQVFHHQHPQPADPTVRHMPRQAIEVVAATDHGPLRVITTHLEFHSAPQRLAQVVRLRELHREVTGNALAPPRPAGESSPYAHVARPPSAIVCGDFNARPGEEAHVAMLAGFEDRTPAFRDAWTLCGNGERHPATCGIHDSEQWPEGPHARDYFFVTQELSGRVRSLDVDAVTFASDHQPVRLALG